MPTYNPGVPTGTVDLDVDYQNLQDNFQQLNIAYGVDHTPFSDTSGVPPGGITGMHKAIHMIPVSTVATNPPNNQPINGYTAVANYGQILSAQINDSINTDESLYFLTGGNRLTQFTRNFTTGINNVPPLFTSGATFIPGGFILNFGYEAGSHGNHTITLKQSYPNNFLCGFATMIRASNNVDTVYCSTNPTLATGGPAVTTVQFYDTSSGNAFYWWTLGN